jgi:hypothetical protein
MLETGTRAGETVDLLSADVDLSAGTAIVRRGRLRTAHKAQRRRWAPLVAAGQVCCVRCGLWIAPGTPWVLGHTDDRTGWIGPEHRACNRAAAGARKGNAARGSVCLRTEGGCQPVQVVAALSGAAVRPDLGQRATIQS